MKKPKMKTWRTLLALALLLGIYFCTKSELAWGTLCTLCPLGFLQVSLAGGRVAVEMLAGVIIALVVIFFLGKAFCAWLCPTALLRNIFTPKKKYNVMKAVELEHSGGCASCAKAQRGAGAYVVLIALLVVSFIVKFPVFCMVCPIGLAFGTLFAINKVFVFFQPGWELLVFPALLAAEVLFFRSWCSKICPLGALFSLINKVGNVFVRPIVKHDVCLSHKGAACSACEKACPEGINPVTATKKDLQECTLCLECKEKCPSEAVHFVKNPNKNGNKKGEGIA